MVAVLGAAGVCASAGTALAASSSGSQYGPPAVIKPAAEGGFTAVITTVTIPTTGGTVGPVAVPGGSVTVSVPPGAFPEAVTITVTAPSLGTIPPVTGDTVTTGAGITVGLNGAPFPGTFLEPLTATFTSSSLTAASEVEDWNGAAFVPDPSSTDAAGVATATFSSDPDLAVDTPTSTTAVPVPKATVPVTGVPVVGEGILAGVLILGGAGGLAASRRRRARASAQR